MASAPKAVPWPSISLRLVGAIAGVAIAVAGYALAKQVGHGEAIARLEERVAEPAPPAWLVERIDRLEQKLDRLLERTHP